MKALVTLIFIILLVSCSHSYSNAPVDRPGAPETSENAELDDYSMRISSPMLTLRYDDGGILFCLDDDGTVSAARLSDDCRFEFDPSTPSLRVNGATIPLASATLAKENNDCRWYRLTTPDSPDPIYIVIAGL